MKIEKCHIEALEDWLRLETRIVGLSTLTGEPCVDRYRHGPRPGANSCALECFGDLW